MGKGREIRQIVKQRIRVIISNEAKDDGEGRAGVQKQNGRRRRADYDKPTACVLKALSSSLPHFPSVHHLISVTNH